jgi:hypothetical protein
MEGPPKPLWHISRDGKQYGPVSDQDLLRLAEQGKLSADDLVWKPGFDTWRTVQSVPGLLTPPQLGAAPLPLPPAFAPPREPPKEVYQKAAIPEKKGLSAWSPFQKLESEAACLEAAKAGAATAGIIGIGYVISMGFLLLAGADLWGSTDVTSTTISYAIAIALAAFLGWRIFKKQSVWASAVILVWAMAETAFKMSVLDSTHRVHPASFLVNFVAIVAAILSVRGSLKLNRLRRAEKVARVQGQLSA